MKSSIGEARIKEALRARQMCARSSAHAVHSHPHENHKRRDRAFANSRLRNKRYPEEETQRKLKELNAAVANISKYLNVQQVPNVSFLDDVLLALELKQSGLPEVTLPQEFIDALSSDDF
ncbi:MAG TPA: hypothetical protein VHT91_06675 [Kofleriaceae bacterium]|jgi:hypothetical protein|nr:hypothetical protein [Kofleriaceae bacterium]